MYTYARMRNTRQIPRLTPAKTTTEQAYNLTVTNQNIQHDMNNTTDTTAAQNVTFAIISDWMTTAQAKEMMNDLVGREIFTKKQIKKSGYLFANGKDKSDGYICRVLAMTGICPEMERGFRQPRGKHTRKNKAVVSVPVEVIAAEKDEPIVKEVMLYVVQSDEDPQPTEELIMGMTEWNSKWNQATRARKIHQRAVELFGESVEYQGWDVVK